MEVAKVVTELNTEISTNRKLMLRHPPQSKSNFTSSNEMKHTHKFHTDVRTNGYSPGKRCEMESPVGPESINAVIYKNFHRTVKSKDIFSADTRNNSEHFSTAHSEKSTLHKTKSSTRSNLDSEMKMKVRARKNKNETLRLSKRNTCIASLQELSGEESDTRRDAAEKEELRLTNFNGERDEDKNYLQSKHKGKKDFVVHSSEIDYETAKMFLEDLLKLGIPNLTVDNFVHVNPGKTEMESISSLHEQYNTVLLFVTHSYTKDKLRRRQAEMLLVKGLETEGLENWLVPVWVEKDVKKSIFELTLIKGIQYHQTQRNNEDFSRQVSDLVMTGRERVVY